MLDLTCTDLDEFVESLPGLQGHFLITRRATQAWRIRLVEHGGVRLSIGQEGGSYVFQVEPNAHHLVFYLRVRNSAAASFDGHRLTRNSLGCAVPGREATLRVDEPALWLSFHIPHDRLERHMESCGEDSAPEMLSRCQVMGLQAASARAFVAFAHRSFTVTASDPQAFDAPAAAEMFARQLTDLFFRSLDPTATVRLATHGRRARTNRHAILASVLDLMDSCIDQNLHVEDLCKAARTSFRTLHYAFEERFGIGPHRYLMLCRLHAIHHALRFAAPSDTVSAICGRYGVWDFGRFADHYRQLFGLLPSQTMAMPPAVSRPRPDARPFAVTYARRGDGRPPPRFAISM